MFDDKNPNYLLVKFFSRDVLEDALKKPLAGDEDSLKDQYSDIRDQVCFQVAFIWCVA
jgi:hypothetical protein